MIVDHDTWNADFVLFRFASLGLFSLRLHRLIDMYSRRLCKSVSHLFKPKNRIARPETLT